MAMAAEILEEKDKHQIRSSHENRLVIRRANAASMGVDFRGEAALSSTFLGQHCACLRRIFRDLCLQGIETGEFPLLAQMLDEGDAQMRPVEIAGKIEEMRLEAKRGPLEGGAIAEIGDPRMEDATLECGAHRIDAGGRPEIIIEPEIGGGKAQVSAALIAALDPSLDLPEPAEKGGRR